MGPADFRLKIVGESNWWMQRRATEAIGIARKAFAGTMNGQEAKFSDL